MTKKGATKGYVHPVLTHHPSPTKPHHSAVFTLATNTIPFLCPEETAVARYRVSSWWPFRH